MTTIFYYSKNGRKKPGTSNTLPTTQNTSRKPTDTTTRTAKGPYCTMPLHAAGISGGESGEPWNGYSPGSQGNHWRTPTKGIMNAYIQEKNLITGWPEQYPNVHDRLQALDRAKLIAWSENGVPRIKTYLSATKGIALTDLITDIPMATKNERTGSPDQKPLALYELIIRASSNEGDLVLDPLRRMRPPHP